MGRPRAKVHRLNSVGWTSPHRPHGSIGIRGDTVLGDDRPDKLVYSRSSSRTTGRSRYEARAKIIQGCNQRHFAAIPKDVSPTASSATFLLATIVAIATMPEMNSSMLFLAIACIAGHPCYNACYNAWLAIVETSLAIMPK